jgi:uncharacterized protein DUF3310
VPTEKPDLINHPAHYGGDSVHETIKCMEAHGLDRDFCLGNSFKYLTRAGKKSPELLSDLKKAAWYLARKIAKLEKENAE